MRTLDIYLVAPIPDVSNIIGIAACGMIAVALMLHWVPVVMAVVAAASAIYGGVSGSNAAKANAKAAQLAAFNNARNIYETGYYNAQAILKSQYFNNQLSAALVKMNVESNWDVTMYNADLRMLIGDYNAKVREKEAFDIWQSAELDVTQVENTGERAKGDILASYGASGAQINSTDSVADAMIDAESQIEFEKFIIRYGADIRAGHVKNEAARSRWDGYMAAHQIIYEGGMSNINALVNTGVKMIGSTIQSSIDASMTYNNAVRGAANTFVGGSNQADMYNAQASQAMASGLVSAAGAAISAYMGAGGGAKQAGGNDGTTWGIATDSSVRPAESYNRLYTGAGNSQYGNYSANLYGGHSQSSAYSASLFEN